MGGAQAGVRFDVRVAHAHRPLKAYLAVLAETMLQGAREDRAASLKALDSLKARALVTLDASQTTDAQLLFAPTTIALAALFSAATDAGERNTQHTHTPSLPLFLEIYVYIYVYLAQS